jgi:hypothetical protein
MRGQNARRKMRLKYCLRDRQDDLIEARLSLKIDFTKTRRIN